MGLAQEIEKIEHPENGIKHPEEVKRQTIVHLIEDHLDNPTLQQAMCGTSLEEQQRALVLRYHTPLPLTRPTPNPQQNEKVAFNEKLLGPLPHLKSTSGFCLNNIIDATLGTLGAITLSAGGVYSAGTPIELNTYLGLLVAGGIMGIILPLCYNNESHRLEEAQLLDETIQKYMKQQP